MQLNNDPIMKKNICDKIKITCSYVNQHSKFVKINETNILKLINENKFQNYLSNVPSWKSCHIDACKYDFELVLAFIFVVDSLNFCFWPYEELNTENDFEYGDLVSNITDCLEKCPEFFTPIYLSSMSVTDLCEKVFKNKDFPLLEERTRSLNELGIFIHTKYNSSFKYFLEKCNYDCLEIISKIVEGVTTYRDETIYQGRQIFIYKRAQILAADIFYMCKELSNPIILKNAEDLTMFADYRVPQILLDLGILEYEEDLMRKILNKERILPNSLEETEIRANTVVCVEKIKNIFNKSFTKNILSLEVDYVLWNIGEERRKEILPHHRTLTIFY